jgi:membrane dipeptidase
MDRRQFVVSGLALPLSYATGALAAEPIYIGDMHAHFFFDREGKGIMRSPPLRGAMAAGNATPVAWSLVGDLLWMGLTPRGFAQKSVPKPSETLGWFERELARIKKHAAEQNLKIVRTASDVDRAMKGEPHVVLAVEGASFIEDDPRRVQAAYDLGVRHLQLVHYIKNSVGDFQTEKPEHGGLTDVGKKVVQECNRLGILVDLAHSTSDAVTQALEISKAPMVWSHSSVTRQRKPDWTMVGWRARQLTLDGAKAIASKRGVVGLWALRLDVGESIEAYADRLLELADWLGEDHVAFGSDMNGLGRHAVINEYGDFRRLMAHWEKRQVPEGRVRKLAIGNYAHVLRKVLG